jgi:hypothetical protein
MNAAPLSMRNALRLESSSSGIETESRRIETAK